MIALFSGVVVAGLGIGALISAYQNRGTPPAVMASSVPRVTPVASEPPLAVVTAAPSPSATPTAAPTRSPAPTSTPTAQATVKPSSAPPPTPAVTATPTPASAPTPTASPRRVAALTPAPTATPTPPPAATLPPAPVRTATPALSETATALVRRYLNALVAGNEAGAYTALGGSAGDRGLSLKEEAFVDKETRIVALRTTHADASSATIEAELASPRGNYFATYHIVNGPNGPIIDQHDYIRM